MGRQPFCFHSNSAVTVRAYSGVGIRAWTESARLDGEEDRNMKDKKLYNLN